MWEISPTLVRYDMKDGVSPEIALAGLAPLGTKTKDVTVSGAPFKKPIGNFYQTDPISRA
jgi:NADH dehydrogenase (ubiquinone) Fe-S protein 1